MSPAVKAQCSCQQGAIHPVSFFAREKSTERERGEIPIHAIKSQFTWEMRETSQQVAMRLCVRHENWITKLAPLHIENQPQAVSTRSQFTRTHHNFRRRDSSRDNPHSLASSVKEAVLFARNDRDCIHLDH